ncbi:MAG TPA: DUF6607 family protein, partial [Polyangiaceae bacterium]|nr:DUF6607 family protein [Polyangiaceae bacterium]
MSTPLEILVVTLSVAALSSGCAAHGSAAVAQSPTAASAPSSSCDMQRDQKAIASMVGSYDVVFDFEETEALTPGYQKHESHQSYATELVLLVDDAPGRVSLQHILQIGDGPHANIVKHWRQDWTFEDRELLEFRGKDEWQRRTLPADAVRCTWTQAVFGVDDAPRYDGYGRWTHDAKGSVWESNETWRPLPRREYTTRNDYDVLVAVNKHRITANGWEHEQENSKLVLEPRHFLVREHGKNSYTHTEPADTQVAAAYWQATSPFWKEVRAEWARIFART